MQKPPSSGKSGIKSGASINKVHSKPNLFTEEDKPNSMTGSFYLNPNKKCLVEGN